jgi:hypothetical protein
MNHTLKTFVATAVLTVLGVVAVSSNANAFGLRAPQVPVLGGTLQGYLNSKGESINVLTDQQDAQVYSQSASGNALLTLMVTLTPSSNVDQIGIYNAAAVIPPLFFVLSASSGPGAFSTLSFKPGNILVVNRFDGAANFVSTTTYGGVDPNNFGFYISTPGGTFFSQDGRNPGAKAQMLAYQGTGINNGEWWLCFEDLAVAAGSDQDFDDAVLILESVNPLPVQQSTWGGVKSLYRR